MTAVEPTEQPTCPAEPEDRSIVAWFNGEGVVSRVLMRVDDYARLSGADLPDHWFEADDRSDGRSFDWESLCTELRDLHGPVVLAPEGGMR